MSNATRSPLDGQLATRLITFVATNLDDETDVIIIRLFFGLDNNQPQTLEDIGRVVGLAPELVRERKNRALKLLAVQPNSDEWLNFAAEQ